MSEIEKYNPQHPELWDSESGKPIEAWNGNRKRTTTEQAMGIFVPMFAVFPKVETNRMMLEEYVRLLQDIPPDKLKKSVDNAMQDSDWPPTVAAIRRQYEQMNQRDSAKPFISDEEFERPQVVKVYRKSREERMEQLRRYKNRSSA